MLVLIPIISLLAYRAMVGNLVLEDKITYIFDSISTKNNENKNFLRSTFKELKTYDNILINSLANNLLLKNVQNSILYSNKKISEINISQFKGDKIYKISSSSKNKNPIIKNKILKKYTSNWNNGNEFNKLDDESFLIVNKYKKGNADYIISKLINKKMLLSSTDFHQSFNTYVINSMDFEVLYSNTTKDKFDNEHIGQLKKHLKDQKNLLDGVKVFNIKENNYFVAYDQLQEGLIVVTVLEESAILGVIKELDQKSILFLFVAISFAGILSIFTSRKFNNTLQNLQAVAKRITNGDYQNKSINKTNDEIGDLAHSFEIMGSKVSNLMQELTNQNLILEKTVAKRTKDLKSSLELQSTMINSLKEGFLIVDVNGRISPTFSKVSKDLLNQDPSKKIFGDLLKFNKDESRDITSIIQAIINQKAPFSELKQFLPDQTLINNKIIYLDYSPMQDEDGEITNLVISAVDKTSEVESLKENLKQENYVKMVLSILKDKEGYLEFISRIKGIQTDFNNITEQQFYRLIHTLSGLSSYYHLDKLTKELKAIEKSLEEKKSRAFIQEIISKLYVELNILAESQEKWLGINPCNINNKKTITVNVDILEKFTQMLKTEDVSHDLYSSFLNHIVSVPVMNYFNKYSDMINHLSVSEGIKVSKVEWIGFENKVFPERYDKIFLNFIHIYKNIMAHAFLGREGLNNEITNTVSIQEKNDIKYLVITVKDNGVGVDTNSVVKELKEKNLYKESMTNDEILNSIFLDEISTSPSIDHLSGHGVGLSSLKNSITHISGKIQVVSKLNNGTTIKVAIPIQNDFINMKDKVWKKAA